MAASIAFKGKTINFWTRDSLIVGQKSMGGGNEGCGELEGIWGFEAIMGSKESSSFGDVVGNGKDRKMGEVAKKDYIPWSGTSV